MVQLAGETKLDARSGHNRTDLADSLPDHSGQLRIRVRADVSRKGQLAGGVAVCH